MTEELEQILKDLFTIRVWGSVTHLNEEYVTVVNYTSIDNIIEYAGYQTHDPYNPHEFIDKCSIFEFKNKYYPIGKICGKEEADDYFNHS